MCGIRPWNAPAATCQSIGLTDAASSLTSTSPGPGSGLGRPIGRGSSPNCSIAIARIDPPFHMVAPTGTVPQRAVEVKDRLATLHYPVDMGQVESRPLRYLVAIAEELHFMIG